MGAGQSNTTNAGGESHTTYVKTSYYELLGIERDATEDEIKKAYRRKALELHPDRNYGKVEDVTALFAEVQSAYEVLSDPQERAWYDSHESAILRGDDGSGGGQHFEHDVKVTSADDIARMTRRFNSAVDFSDSPSGFFGYLRETFAQLAKEEEIAAHWENVDVPDYPSFGHKDDRYDDVVKSFYAVWNGFATKKTFAWKDHFKLSEAPDRRYRRLMEKENKALREEGIREFNDAVRSLVAFVRKRDPRYTPNTQSEADRQKILRDAAASQAARARAANAAKLSNVVPEWAQVAERDEHEGEIAESESEEEHYECVACRKTFKSEKQWDAHEKSKKHQKAIQTLRKKMEKDNRHFNLENDESSSGVMTPASEDDLELVDDEVGEHVQGDVEGEEMISNNDFNNLVIDEDSHKSPELEGPDEEEDQVDQLSTRSHEESTKAVEKSDTESEDNEYASPAAVKSRLQGGGLTAEKSDEESAAPQLPKLGKAAQKRARKAAAGAKSMEGSDTRCTCAQCGATFPSKTRLFQHIKDFGHAAPKLVTAGGSKGKKGKK